MNESTQQKPTAKKSKHLLATTILALILIGFLAALMLLGLQTYKLRNKTIQLQSKLEQTQNNIAAIASTNKQKSARWLLPEIKYLIQLANINLTLDNNAAHAYKLLQTADKRLAKTNDPIFIPVREALAKDINTLQNSPRVDLPGIISQLDALSEQIATLPIVPSLTKQAVTAKTPTAPIKTNKKPQTTWQCFWNTTLTKLKNVIIVQRLEQPMPALPTIEQQTYLKQSLQLLLEQAEWAVLHKQPTVYKSALTRANKVAQIYLSHNLAALKTFTQTVTELQKVVINPPQPNISQSMQTINAAVEQELMDREAA
ncbi:MAG: uroporphyrinogen-III C-methyltransferase [Gammaproteobacteria bacterium]|nr:uroporphyrinogen-III C-methyltransferase [Gammaproteobacteria bacterium]